MIQHSLNTRHDCLPCLHTLLETAPEKISRTDIALLNLLCAVQLSGSESLNIPACLSTLDRLAANVKRITELNAYHLRIDPDFGHSEPMWRMASLVTTVKRDFGATYSPQAAADLAAGIRAPFSDASEVFLHGLLNPDRNRRWGTCTSIPVLIVAVARRLGYSVSLAVTRRHVCPLG